MPLDTIVDNSASDDDDSDSCPADRIASTRMKHFGVGSLGLASVMSAVVGLVCPRNPNDHLTDSGTDDTGPHSADEENVSVDGMNDEDHGHDGPVTANGAPCLATTGMANVDLFASPFIFFNGTEVSGTVTEDVEVFKSLLKICYNEDAVLCIKNILYLGNLRDGGSKNHPAYMVALSWLWYDHPETFLTVVAPLIASNTCVRDILTLFCVVTYNRTFPLSRLWAGEQMDASRNSRRDTLLVEEKLLWKSLLKEIGKKSSQVVHAEPLIHTRMPSPVSTDSPISVRTRMHSPVSPISPSTTISVVPVVLNVSVESDNMDMDSQVAPEMTSLLADAVLHSPVDIVESTPSVTWVPVVGGDDTSPMDEGDSSESSAVAFVVDETKLWGKRRKMSGVIPSTGYLGKKKNVWDDENFRMMWHAARSKLHNRDYGSFSGLHGTPEHYQRLCDFVVEFFATGITDNDSMIAKWAPSVDGAHDKASKGVGEFNLPESWGGTGGLSQAIAWKMYGHLVKQSANDGILGIIYEVPAQKKFVMSMYNKAVSTLRKQFVPESLEGNIDTFQQTPDLSKVTGRWRSYKQARILKTPEQKANLLAFTERAVSGEKGFKVTSGNAKPHLLLEEVCQPNPGGTPAEVSAWEIARKTAVMQWEDMQQKVTKALAGSDYVYIPVVDVSGSMSQGNGTAMKVAVALGILLSFANDKNGPYYKTVLPFDSTCSAVKLSAGDNMDRFDCLAAYNEELRAIPWGGSTNLENVFTEVAYLEKKRLVMAGPDAKPKRACIVIISDMCFNDGVTGFKSGEKGMDSMLKPDVLKRVCLEAGLVDVPVIAFWDAANSGATVLPAGVDSKDVILMSGSSDGPFQALLTADFSDVSPLGYFRQAMAKLPYTINSEDIVD